MSDGETREAPPHRDGSAAPQATPETGQLASLVSALRLPGNWIGEAGGVPQRAVAPGETVPAGDAAPTSTSFPLPLLLL